MLELLSNHQSCCNRGALCQDGQAGPKAGQGKKISTEVARKRWRAGRCPSLRHFSSHREKSSILQQRNPVSPGPLVLLTLPHSRVSGCSTGAEVRVSPHAVPLGDSKSYQEGWERVTAPGNQRVQSRGKESNSIYTFTKTHEMHIPVTCLPSDLLLERLSPLKVNCKRKWS